MSALVQGYLGRRRRRLLFLPWATNEYSMADDECWEDLCQRNGGRRGFLVLGIDRMVEVGFGWKTKLASTW